MRLLLTGASGLIGTRLLERFARSGHAVLCAGRRPPAELPPNCSWQRIDFASASRADWLPCLNGVDAVVNAVGIFRERRDASFERLHADAPRELFEACVAAGVRRVVHLSALGADEAAQTPYHRSKRRGDALLLALPLQAVVVQPSLVFAADGPSARAFLALAALPIVPLPAGGEQALQPLHVDDAVQAIQALVEAPPDAPPPRRVALVGPRPLSLRQYLLMLRAGLGLGRAITVAVPKVLVDLGARLGDRFPGALLDRAAWSMLQRGNTAPADAIGALIGGPPRDASRFIAPREAADLRTGARLAWLLPVIRASLALVWIVTGIVSLGLYPVEASFELLARAGVPAALRPTALYGAALLDLVFGVLTLLRWRGRRWLWPAQAALIIGYTVIISLRLPEFWLHPYGPLLKNLPMLALLWLLWALEPPDAKRPVRPASRP
jgi:uncharacterized protein YbjT (DUF2867 family)